MLVRNRQPTSKPVHLLDTRQYIAFPSENMVRVRHFPIVRKRLLSAFLDELCEKNVHFSRDPLCKRLRTAGPVNYQNITIDGFRKMSAHPWVNISLKSLTDLDNTIPDEFVRQNAFGLWWLLTVDEYLSKGQICDIANYLGCRYIRRYKNEQEEDEEDHAENEMMSRLATFFSYHANDKETHFLNIIHSNL